MNRLLEPKTFAGLPPAFSARRSGTRRAFSSGVSFEGSTGSSTIRATPSSPGSAERNVRSTWGGSMGVVFSHRAGSHWEVSPAMKP